MLTKCVLCFPRKIGVLKKMKSDEDILNGIKKVLESDSPKPLWTPQREHTVEGGMFPYPIPFKQSFGVEVSFYPNGKAWISKTFPLGGAKSFKKVSKGKKVKIKIQKPQVTGTEEY